jgi:hypothetical protein
MRERETARKKWPRFRRRFSAPNGGRMVLAAMSLLARLAFAGQPVEPSDQQSNTRLDSVTVQARRETLERQVSAFLSAISIAPSNEALARWENPTFICPLVGGLPRDDGEFILKRLSSIALAAGAPLGPAGCKPNLYIIVTSEPDALLKAWGQRDVNMFGDESGATRIKKFVHASIPIRAWYNATLYTSEGAPLTVMPEGPLKGIPYNPRAMGFRLTRDDVRDLTSVIVLIDARSLKGTTFGQVAAYVAMVGLAEVRLGANMGDAPSILQLFKASGHITAPGLSSWDQAFLKALYHTRHADPDQLGEIKISVVKDLAP